MIEKGQTYRSSGTEFGPRSRRRLEPIGEWEEYLKEAKEIFAEHPTDVTLHDLMAEGAEEKFEGGADTLRDCFQGLADTELGLRRGGRENNSSSQGRGLLGSFNTLATPLGLLLALATRLLQFNPSE